MMNIASIAVSIVFAVFSISFNSSINGAGEPSKEHPIQTDKEKIQSDNDNETNKSKTSKKEASEKKQTDKKVNATNKPTTVKVKPSDTLAKIAEENNTTSRRIFNANEVIKRPDIIVAGEQLTIPADDEALPDRLAKVNARIKAELAKAQERQEQREERARQQQQAKQRQQNSARQTQPQNTHQEPSPQPSGNTNTNTWERLAQCESGGNWQINTGNGYYGGLQFNLRSWRSVGGSGYPHQASKSEQIARGEQLKAIQGWGAWPTCATKLGLL